MRRASARVAIISQVLGDKVFLKWFVLLWKRLILSNTVLVHTNEAWGSDHVGHGYRGCQHSWNLGKGRLWRDQPWACLGDELSQIWILCVDELSPERLICDGHNVSTLHGSILTLHAELLLLLWEPRLCLAIAIHHWVRLPNHQWVLSANFNGLVVDKIIIGDDGFDEQVGKLSGCRIWHLNCIILATLRRNLSMLAFLDRQFILHFFCMYDMIFVNWWLLEHEATGASLVGDGNLLMMSLRWVNIHLAIHMMTRIRTIDRHKALRISSSSLGLRSQKVTIRFIFAG